MRELESQLDEIMKSPVAGVDQWLLDGLQHWIRTFMPNRINLRIFPIESCPSFQLICNLKRDCFVDEDLEHLLYGYGPNPDVKLAVFGLVTSIPPEGEADFNTFSGTPAEPEGLESAFRNMFQATNVIEAMVRYSRYPNVSIHPFAVFRMIDAPRGREAV